MAKGKKSSSKKSSSLKSSKMPMVMPGMPKEMVKTMKKYLEQ